MHPYLRLRVFVRPCGEDVAIAATRVRRVLGKALIDLFCTFGGPVCESKPPAGKPPQPPSKLCHMATSCPYGVLFAASRSPRPPYALYVPTRTDGDQEVELTLLGPGWRWYAWALTGLERAFDLGLGRERHRFEIVRVLQEHGDGRCDELCRHDLRELPPLAEPDLLGLGLEPYVAPQPVQVELLSPLRLVVDGKLVGGGGHIDLKHLVGRILDRFRGIYGDEASEVLRPEIRAVLETEAAKVPLLVDETRWLEVPDYSARNDAELLLGGKVGRLVFGEGAARFYPILRTGEVLHIGKNPASGCGRISVSLAESEA